MKILAKQMKQHMERDQELGREAFFEPCCTFWSKGKPHYYAIRNHMLKMTKSHDGESPGP